MSRSAPRSYRYVGPDNIRAAAVSCGQAIRTREELVQTLSDLEGETLTFVVDLNGRLRLADRHAEHVACAGGENVLSAGEITFSTAAGHVSVDSVTNQSTGYCPEPESYSAVAAALDRLEVDHPGRFTRELHFRRCPDCGQTNLVKDDYYVCDLCGSELPRDWNYQTEDR